MTTLEDFQTDIGLLVETGLLAIKQGDEESAKKLFNAVEMVDESGMQKKFGYGLIALHKMEVESAVEQFEAILQKDKKNYRAKAFLGFAHILTVFGEKSNTVKETSLKRATELAKEVVAECKEKSTVQVAQSILDWEAEIQSQASGKQGPMA